ncbi:hypothetical protein B6U80_00715 [Candidatus Pacearchaeota archaeon ex4484_26]|nr:MAG: hypothetical protein B6U80_00715 [Candidatus Pacearchaeota archaeon ex4484_26]
MRVKILTWRSILSQKEKQEVFELERSTTERCKYLGNINGFYYCRFNLSEEEEKEAVAEHPHVYNRLFKRHSDPRRLEMWCMSPNAERCIIRRDDKFGVRLDPETKMYLE